MLIVWTGAAWPQDVPGCGSLTNAYGPFDYTNNADFQEKLPIVEQYHFSPDVEALHSGESSTIGGDLDYTLRAFPNHHRALYAVARYALQPDTPARDTHYFTPECYFDRAIAFKPDDGMVHMIYGIFLHEQHKLPAALAEYQKAVKLMPNSAEAHYNLGLLYADMREYANAKEHAHQAYRLGYPLQGLKNKLVQAGAWNQN